MVVVDVFTTSFKSGPKPKRISELSCITQGPSSCGEYFRNRVTEREKVITPIFSIFNQLAH